MKLIRKLFGPVIDVLEHMTWLAIIVVLIILIVIFSGASIIVTGQPGFCKSCHIMDSYYTSWEESAHKEVNCLDCHLKPGFAGYLKGKINGLSQAVDCMVGRVGTKPNAVIEDVSCLRAECHHTEQLTSKEINFNGEKIMARVLIVDDDIDLVMSLQVLLESEQYDVSTAATTEEGMEKVGSDKPDLIILDVMMTAWQDGFEMARDLHKQPDFDEIPILMLTAVKNKTGMDFKISAGDPDWLPVDAFMDKPVDPDDLLTNIRELLAGKK